MEQIMNMKKEIDFIKNFLELMKQKQDIKSETIEVLYDSGNGIDEHFMETILELMKQKEIKNEDESEDRCR